MGFIEGASGVSLLSARPRSPGDGSGWDTGQEAAVFSPGPEEAAGGKPAIGALGVPHMMTAPQQQH